MKKHVVVLSGAGMSAESGINTFRDADGLWEGHDVMTVASPQGWHADPELVLDFYNQRRRQLREVEPNAGHIALATLEEHYQVDVVTQNVDDLHERAGSANIIHLHGELLKSQSVLDANQVYPCHDDIHLGDNCKLGGQLRPAIVWFGEQVPMLEPSIDIMQKADVVIIVGTSMQVYPAASLAQFAPPDSDMYYIDPKPAMNEAITPLNKLTVIQDTAANALPELVDKLIAQA